MKGSKKQSRRSDTKDFKVKYISSPMKFKASASEFRALVQELTGQDSDAERFMELNNVPDVQKSTSPSSQQWKNIGAVDTLVSEVPDLSYPYHHSYGLQQGSESLFDSMSQGFHFDMLSFDSVQSM